MCLCILTNVQNSAGPQIHSRLSFHLVDSRENLDETKDFKIFRAFPVFALQTASRIYHCKALQWPMHQLWQDMILDDEVQSLVLWYCRSVRWNRKKTRQVWRCTPSAGWTQTSSDSLYSLYQLHMLFVCVYNHICSILLYIEIHVDLILSPHVVMKSHWSRFASAGPRGEPAGAADRLQRRGASHLQGAGDATRPQMKLQRNEIMNI